MTLARSSGGSVDLTIITTWRNGVGLNSKSKSPAASRAALSLRKPRGLARIINVTAAANVVTSILESEINILRGTSEEETDAAQLMLKYADQKIGFADCVSFVQMRKNKIRKVFGFDRRFSLAGFTLWPGSKRKD